MKARDALIAWTPIHYADYDGPRRLTVGQVKVGPLISGDARDWTEPYAHTGGAAYTRVRELRGAESALRCFVDFHHIVLRDGIDPQVAHEAFLAIDEYRDCLAADIPGSPNEEEGW